MVVADASGNFYGLFRADLGTTATGTSGSGATAVKSFFEPMGDGYYQCIVVGKVGATSITADVRTGKSDDTYTFVGAADSGMYATAFQLLRCGTTGPRIMSYLGPTAGSALGRSDDVFTVAVPGWKPVDQTWYVKLARPRHADLPVSPTLPVQPFMISLGSGSDDKIQLRFADSSRAAVGFIQQGTFGGGANTTGIPSGRALEYLLQIKDLQIAGASAAIDDGTGLSGFGALTVSVPYSLGVMDTPLAFGGDSSAAGKQLDGALIEAKVAAGLRDMRYMREVW
jgi:hypothetical protein